MKGSNGRRGIYGWIANNIENRSLWFITLILLITATLFFPLILMRPKELASDNPTNNSAVIWNEEIHDKFPSEVYHLYFIVEAYN